MKKSKKEAKEKNILLIITILFIIGFLLQINNNFTGKVVDDVCQKVWYSGEPVNNLDLVYVGHGFNNLEDFQFNAKIFVRVFFEEPTIAPYKNRINIWRVDKLEDLGCTINGIGTLNQGKGFPACDTTKIKPVANNCPNDFAYVIWDNYPENADFSGGVKLDYEHPVMKALFGKKGVFNYIITPILGNKQKYIGSAVSGAILRAYPIRPVALHVIIPHTKCSIAR